MGSSPGKTIIFSECYRQRHQHIILHHYSFSKDLTMNTSGIFYKIRQDDEDRYTVSEHPNDIRRNHCKYK